MRYEVWDVGFVVVVIVKNLGVNYKLTPKSNTSFKILDIKSLLRRVQKRE